MDKVISNILDALRNGEDLDPKALDRIVRARSAEAHDGRRVFAKKRILPYYLRVRTDAGETWRRWNVDDELDRKFVKALQMKPRRTSSGVATITVLTKPWPCANRCVYCPNDPDMPKSYLSDEPACQRAARNGFHPYLQVASRLRTLQHMGHATDKVELIVLGGTWLDYPADYRMWFTCALFDALNDDDATREAALADPERILETGERIRTLEELRQSQSRNESAAHRVVGLVFETRPDTISPAALTQLRELGCTKIQLGIQSIDDGVLGANGRHESTARIAEAIGLVRLFGFKIHAHFMVNLLGATPESDKRDYRAFVTDPAYRPDEVKLYPCVLVAGTELVSRYEEGAWRPYSEQELVDVLTQNLLDTPAFMRVSRMIRDISAGDILVGNKKTNLRQLVEARAGSLGVPIREIRYREIGGDVIDLQALKIDEVAYETATAEEHFLQWITPEGKIAGFLRLSLPYEHALDQVDAPLPVHASEAMIREVHVYGFATAIDRDGESAQHHGLGRALVTRAKEIARAAGFTRINVISSVGVRQYYRKLGFRDAGLYQSCDL